MTESPKRRFSQRTADFRRFTPSPGNSSIWRAQETAENRRFSQKPQIVAENRRKPQIGLRHLRSVTFSSALPPFTAAQVSLPESTQTLAVIASCAAGDSGRNLPAASTLAGKPFQQEISDSLSLLSSFLTFFWCAGPPQFLKKGSENAGAHEIFHTVRSQLLSTAK